MSMKTILVPMENHDAMRSSLETALLLARRCDSYIEGFALRLQINAFAEAAMLGGFSLERYTEDIAEEAKEARQIFESFMQKHNVRAQPRRQSLCHSAGWTMRQTVRASLAATAVFST
jgi:hypothetical protein